VAVIAAYRDQHKVTTDDPLQVLGPYAGHRAYWHAARSVLAARQLTGLEPGSGTSADARAAAQLAADIYRALPDDERAAVTELATALSGQPPSARTREPDEQAAGRAAYSRQLISVLTSRGHLTGMADYLPSR